MAGAKRAMSVELSLIMPAHAHPPSPMWSMVCSDHAVPQEI